MAPRKLRPVDPPPDLHDLVPEPEDGLDVLADTVDRVDSLREHVDPALRRAYDHAVVDLRHHADAVRALFQHIGNTLGARS